MRRLSPDSAAARRISVIMPCFNAEKYLHDAISSVFAQTYQDVELVVVDDGSTDRSRDILRCYGDRILLIEESNKGPYPARNRGIEASSGEFIAFLDADDYWEPDCLHELHEALRDNDAALAYCGWQNVGTTHKRGEPYIPPDYELGDKAEQFLRSASPWPIHAALTRRAVLEEVGGFDERWATCMDYDLWLRIGLRYPIKRVPRVLAYYRHHDQGQITSTAWRQARNVWLIKRRFVRTYPQCVSHFSRRKLRQLLHGALLRRGYEAYWRRELVSAQRIFRLVLGVAYWRPKDLKYLLPALLPRPMYQALVQSLDHRAKEESLVRV